MAEIQTTSRRESIGQKGNAGEGYGCGAWGWRGPLANNSRIDGLRRGDCPGSLQGR